MNMYRLWAWTYIDGEYRSWKKTIKRKNTITKTQEDRLLGTFTGNIMRKYNCSLGLWGCDKI